MTGNKIIVQRKSEEWIGQLSEIQLQQSCYYVRLDILAKFDVLTLIYQFLQLLNLVRIAR